MSTAALVIVVVVAIVVANDAVVPISDSLQDAFQKDAAFWTSLNYKEISIAPARRPNPNVDDAVLLSAFIDLYMNDLRLSTSATPLADFVASLPTASDVLFEIDPHPDVTEPSPKRSPSFHNLLDVLSSFLQPRDDPPVVPSSLDASRLVLGIFGPMIRAALYGTDQDQAKLASQFVAEYVRSMTRSLPRMAALAVLARGLCLAPPCADPEAEFAYACHVLRRRAKRDGTPLDLSDAINLISAGIVGKVDDADLVDMSATLVLDLFVGGLRRQNKMLQALCERDAAKSRKNVGFKSAAIAESVVFLMVVSETIDSLPELVQALGRTTVDQMRLLALLALFCARNADALERAKGLAPAAVPAAIADTIQYLKEGPVRPLAPIPSLYMMEQIQERVPGMQLEGATWPMSSTSDPQ